jgi:hypothetical protein
MSWSSRPHHTARPDHREMFAAYGRASYFAQEFESLLLVNLQYSLALAGEFANLDEVDRAASRRDAIPIGQVFKRLEAHLEGEKLMALVPRAIKTRNSLVHHFFRDRRVGLAMTPAETTAAISWCESAHGEFIKVIRLLDDRATELWERVMENPDAIVSGLLDRMKAIERGEWPPRSQAT